MSSEELATDSTRSGDGAVEPVRGARASTSLRRRREELDRTLWASEIEALEHERTFVELWDDLRVAKDALAIFEAFPFTTLSLGSLGEAKLYDADVFRTPFVAPTRSLTRDEWTAVLARMRGFGFRLVQSEWHHEEYHPAAAGPARSVVAMTLHVESAKLRRRIIVRGALDVEWSSRRDASGRFVPERIDASGLELIDRKGDVPFRPRLTVPAANASAAEIRLLRARRAHPLILYDLDRDGLSEIVLGGWNRVYWNHGGGKFEWGELCRFPREIAPAGIIADLTGDGRADFVCVAADSFLYLYRADNENRFRQPSTRCWAGSFRNPTVFTAGDYDGDGDLDLWAAQYKPAYTGGQMPTPFFDANDGHPSFLLRNDGTGRFTDVTEAAGLGSKRFRRTYSASFVDLDDDGDLDLLNVADFCGIDVYRNEGDGRFTDVTAQWVKERHNTAMAHSFADFDLDGRLDFLVIGMGSSTVRRLDRLGLGRPKREEVTRMRGVLTYGNRMYLRRDLGFEEPTFRDEVARTGWSWGASAFDFDADGDSDVYIANGNISSRSARDYCSEFWRHDLYLGDSSENADLESHFLQNLDPLMRGELSWNGFEHNALLMNRAGDSFLDVAFLMGVAFETDGRGVVTDDLDGDGRLDLVVSEERTVRLRSAGQTIRVYQNLFPRTHHWIGVRLHEEGGGLSPVGAKILVKSETRLHVATITTGDSLRSQHATNAYFGLGDTAGVEWLEVRWVNGTVRRIDTPDVDRYHLVQGR